MEAQVRQLAAEQVALMDLKDLVEIDDEAFQQLDAMPEDDAIAIIDEVMTAIFYT